jgi:hypothetical protein
MGAGTAPWAVAEPAADNRAARYHRDVRRIAKDRPLARHRVRGEKNHRSDGQEQRERPGTAHAFISHAAVKRPKRRPESGEFRI